jgi:5-methyltetrahydrofolate--homocysteine methyltransferase
MACTWKEDWDKTARRFDAWWSGKGLIVSHWGNGLNRPGIAKAESAHSSAADWRDPAAFARSERAALEGKTFPLDIVPFVFADYGTVSLAPLFGSPVNFGRDTVWYSPSDLSPDNDRRLLFDESHPFWRNLIAVVDESRALAGDSYFVGSPALAPGLDVLAELCGATDLMMHLALEPDWVHSKLREIQDASYMALDALYPHIRADDGSMFHAFFMFWSRKRAGFAQCDTAGMISPAMFEEFCVPYLREYCDRFDRVLYHVDGPQALRTVDMLLEIDGISAIEYTPGPQVPPGSDPSYHALYRKIKAAGKSVQAVWIKPVAEDIERLLDAVGPEGMYLEIEYDSMNDVENVARVIEKYVDSEGMTS